MPKESELYLIKAWMNVFAETKTNEEKENYEYIWKMKFYLKEREVL